ncbi:MAG: hypothetical protein M3Q78_09260 [Acidobacteriota bacterium]|nr:hypothetical protein [Acidobacteriota bacterium]
MNKHIFGFILFSLIVGTSAFIYGFFYSPLAAIQPVYVFENRPEKRKSCRKETYSRVERATVNAKVVQAVFNSNTNELDMDLFLDLNNRLTEEATVKFHFFAKDGAETRYLKTEKVILTPNDKMTYSITKSYGWLNNLKSRGNLYVVPQTIGDGESYQRFTPRFDETNAMAITLVGKD